MSSSISPPGKLRSVFTWSLISLLLIGCIWLAAILWWQASPRAISVQEVILLLVVLPIAALVMLVLLRKRRSRKIGFATASTESEAAGAALANAASGPPYALPILAAWAVASPGDSASAFLLALQEKRQRPRPDAELLDENGFPLTTGRVQDLDTASIQDALSQILASGKIAGMQHEDEWREGFLRSLALLSRVVDQIGSDWPLLPTSPDTEPGLQTTGMLRGMPLAPASNAEKLQVHVKLIMPSSFTPGEQALALSYLLEKTNGLPLDAQQLHVTAEPAADDITALVLAEQFNQSAGATMQPQALLLLACESTLCPSVAEQWHAASRIFSPQSPNGLMPGEAGFAVLCINEKALPLSVTDPACRLTHVFKTRRQAPADVAGRPCAAALSQAIGQALEGAGLAGSRIGSVACDADHRTSRTLECIGAMMDHTPQLDAIEHRLAANETCGHTGSASVLGGLVAGVEQARSAGHPVLLFNVGHLFERAAAILIPATDKLQTLGEASAS